MHIDKRLETIASLVPPHCVLADIGTDHAYLPVWLLEQGKIDRAIAGDIAEGPCQAARNTVAMHKLEQQVEVRLGSGLSVLAPGEAGCIAIAGMGAATIISILEADMETAKRAQLLVLQPMAGAAALRAWLIGNGWQLVDEELVDDEPHFYEIIAAKRGHADLGDEAELAVGPVLLAQGHPLLCKQIERKLVEYKRLVANMELSEQARGTLRYKFAKEMLQKLEVLQNARTGNSK